MVRNFLLALLFVPATVSAQNIGGFQGSWHGSIRIMEQDLPIEVTFTYEDDSLYGTIDIPAQMAYNLPVEVVYAAEDSIVFQLETGTGPGVFQGSKMDRSIEGNYQQAGMNYPFSLTFKKSRDEDPVLAAEEELLIPTENGHTSGALLLAESPSPLVLLLNGSGSQDRDETVAGFKVFGNLAAALYEEGYSSFRFDDRGVGNSTGEPDATLEELASDIAGITNYLSTQYPEQFTDIVLLGHSQGGLVATIAAKTVNPAGIIFMASPFLSGDQIINQQIQKISEQQGIPAEIVEQNLHFQNEIYKTVQTGSGWDSLEADLGYRIREQIDQLPAAQRESLGDMDSFIRSQVDRQLSSAKSRWFKSFIEFDPAERISELEIPMLAIFGEKDVQVLPVPNQETAQKLRTDHSLNLEIAEIPEANHLFQNATTGMPGEYGMLEKEFTDGFIEEILQFLERVGG